MKYLDTKENSIEDSVTRVLMGEKLVGGQKKLDKDKDGDIDGKDFAMLRKAAAKKKDKNEMKLGMPGMSSFDPTLRKRKKDVKEGTWAMPDSPKLKMGLKKALQRPIMLGKEGDDATDTIRSFIGDDELYDDLYSAGMKNPKGDARPIIKKAMKRLGIKEDVELDENVREIEKMMKDRKYKGNTSAFDAAVKKKFPRDYKKDDVQDMIRKHAEMNEQYNLDENFRKLAMKGMGTETKRDARVGLTTDFYLPQNGDKRSGKIMRVSRDGYEIMNDGSMSSKEKGMKYTFKFYDPQLAKKLMSENYEIGNDYAKHTLRVTPGQLESDVDDMLGIAQKKNLSMRETLAKLWGMTESKNPFEKKVNEKEHDMVKKVTKTMTGKKPTPIEVNPKTGE